MFDKEKMQHLIANGKMSRRQFMQAAAAAGIAAATAGSMFSRIAHAEPKRGGVFRLGLGGSNTGDSLDPGITVDTFMQNMNQGAVRNSIVEVDAKGRAIPELAASLEPSADAKTWVVKLRKDIEFHSGKTLDADDVIASLQHHVGEGSTSAAKSIVESMGKFRQDDKNTLIFELESGNADFPYLFADSHIVIGAADKSGKIDWAKGDGTGAYSVQEFEPGVRAHLLRNPNYFKSGRGNFDEIKMTAINDGAARMNAMATGQVDAMARCDLKTVKLLGKKPGVTILQTTGTKHFAYPMDTRVAPFNDNHVRMALKLGMDREGFVKTVLRGYGSLGNDHPIGSSQNYYAADLPQRQYDIDKAKWHLKQAGMSSLNVELSASDAAFAGAVDATLVYAEALKPAGINLTVKRAPADGYWDNVWMHVPWSASYWAGRPTPDLMFTIGYKAGGSWTESFWNNKRFEELLVAGRAELDEAKRSAIYIEMQTIVSNEGGTVIPCFAQNVDAASDRIGHGDLAGNWELDGARCCERWWFV